MTSTPDFTGHTAKPAKPRRPAALGKREQKRLLLVESITQDPHLSNREHARRTGTSPTTASAVRAELQETDPNPKLDTKLDSSQPAQRPDAHDFTNPQRVKYARNDQPPQLPPAARPRPPMNRITTISLDEWQRPRRKN